MTSRAGLGGVGGGDGWLSPLRVYLREMYPPLPRFLLAVVWFYAVYLGLAAYYAEPVELVGPVPVAGVLTYFFFYLFLRLSDEWKDRRADRIHFPDRPVPAGRVPFAWIRGMWVASLVIVVVLQIPVGGPGAAFAVLVAYALLMFRYFFLRRWIASSLLLAFATHNPVGFLLNVYGVSLFSRATGHPVLEPFHLGLAFFLWLPAPVWEVARKIRAPTEETDYETYSKVLGPGWAAGLAAAGSVLFAAVGLAVAESVGLSSVGRVGLVLAALAFGWRCVRFAAEPTAERAQLRVPAELWGLVSLALWCLDLLVTHRHAWLPS